MTALRLVLALGIAGLGLPGRAAAQATPNAPPAGAPASPASSPSPAASAPPAASASPAAPGEAPAAVACYPACRDGFTCSQGRCVSWCNPPCPDGQSCIEGRRCEPPLPGGPGRGRVYEPPPPPVKSFEQRSHTLLAFHLGFPGNLDQDGAERDLSTTLGFNVRGDTPVADYLLIGPMLQLGVWSPGVEPEVSSNYYVDLDLVLRLRAPLTTSKINYQIWIGMPVGVTLDILGDDVPDKSGLGLGWNIGALFGGAAHFTSKLGVFGEVGWLQHKVWHDGEVGPDLDFKLKQWCMNLGLVVRN